MPSCLISQISKSSADQHYKDEKIKVTTLQVLADKDQIEKFMQFPKDKKLKKLKSYKEQVQTQIKDFPKRPVIPSAFISKNKRKLIEKSVVHEAQIICTTLGLSTIEKLDYLKDSEVAYLIVDEACQSVELNNLIPFEHNPQKVILVGDQQ